MPESKAGSDHTSRTETNVPGLGQPTAPFTERFDPAAHRRYLSRDLHGEVLDLGAGNGALFPYLRTAMQREPTLHLHAIEPDPGRRKEANRIASAHDLEIHVRSGRAESLPYADGTFDVVIASAVFCTVQDPSRALEEVHRVLKSDGEFRFFEHVRSDGLRGSLQNILTPLWKRVDDGCHLDRRTDNLIQAGPFAIDEIETLSFGIIPVRPFVRGIARPVSHTGPDSQNEWRESAPSATSGSSSETSSRESSGE